MQNQPDPPPAGGQESPYESPLDPRPRDRIDLLVFGRLARLGIRPARICSDAVFLRRAYLDVIGTLPTVQEARAFLADRDPAKRAALVERLLDRGEFADYWAMKWCDLLRVKSEFPINLWPNAVQAYHRWIRDSLRLNAPYSQFARDLLTSSGSNFRSPPANFYRALQSRAPRDIARAVALTFMGSRAERWPTGRLAGMASFFSQIGYKATAEWKEEIVVFDPFGRPPGPPPGPAVFPDGARARMLSGQDPRRVFADWLIRAENPWFAPSIANRVWGWLMGRGIVHEVDDFRPDNPPQNRELLAYLAGELAAARFDWKRLFRLILKSQAYQLSSIPRSSSPQAAPNFAFRTLRRMEAEALIDGLNQITGSTDSYSSAVPEPFTFLPETQRSICLADGSITSSFLELFGRPSRDTGMDSERNNRVTAAQRLHLLNSTHIQRKIERGPNLASLTRFRTGPAEAAETLYLAILSRFPTAEERKAAADRMQASARTPRDGVIDIAWALINSAEFLYRH